MLLWIIIKSSLKSLWAAKLRSFLAILGIIMGVGAVISMLSIVEGARRQIQGIVGSLGTDVLFVWPEYRSASGKGAFPVLKLQDAESVLTGAEAVSRVSPVFSSSGNLKYTNKSTRNSIEGVAPTYLAIRNMKVIQGRAFTDNEVEQGARVVILGPKTAEKLFGTDNALDKSIKVNQLVFRVIGILEARGADGGMGNQDNRVIAPYTTVRRQLMGRHADMSEMCIQAASTTQLKDAEDQIRTILRKNHRIKSTVKDDFGIFNQAQLLETQNKVLGVFTIVLGGIGGICLFTGGIGIMNIMLVIVTERTREIGVRKAVGARRRDILGQFLLEAIVMSGIGGLIGILGGTGLSYLISTITPLKTAVSLQSIFLALSFAAGIGIFFGFYPALRAARLDPIEALRNE